MNSMIREKAVSDAIAGVTVGLTVIPQVLAFDRLPAALGKIRGSIFLINLPLSATHYFGNPNLRLWKHLILPAHILITLFCKQVLMTMKSRVLPMLWWLGWSPNMDSTPPSWVASLIVSSGGEIPPLK